MKELHYHIITPEPVGVQRDRFGRLFMEYTHANPNVGSRRYLVPGGMANEDLPPRTDWIVSDHHVAIPNDKAARSACKHYKSEDEDRYEGGSSIVLVEADHLVIARFIASAAGYRIHGWGTGTSHDCSGRTFASAADSFRVFDHSYRDKGPDHRPQRHRLFGFYTSWSRDV